MNQQSKTAPEEKQKQKRQLYACLDKESGKTFFASFTDQRGMYIDLVSSWNAVRGKAILLLPVPDNWKGGDFTPTQIQKSPDVMEANVSRAVGRGQFQVRVLSLAQQDIVEQIHTGHRKDNLILERSHVGKIDILKLTGRISVESVGRIQSALRTEPCDRRLVLMDARELVSISSSSLGMLHTIVKEEMKNGLYLNFLVKTKSRVESEIMESRILELAPMHDEYEVAVTFLLQSIID
jgi:hypothetical protein